jgi:PKD domain
MDAGPAGRTYALRKDVASVHAISLVLQRRLAELIGDRALRVAVVCAIAAGAVASCGLSTPAASAAPGWLAPSTLALEAPEVRFGPYVAMDGRGDALAAWEGYEGSDETFRLAGGGWQTPGDLNSDKRHAGHPCVAMNEAGEAVALWESANANGRLTIQGAAGSPSQGWQAPATLFEDKGAFHLLGVRGCQVAINASSEAVAVWCVETMEEFEQVWAAYRPADGGWQPAVELDPVGQLAAPTAAIDARGEALAAWGSSGGFIRSVAKPTGSDWKQPASATEPEILSEKNHDATAPHVAFDAEGDALAVWSIGAKYGAASKESVIQASYRPAGGSWEAPVDLSEPGQLSYAPGLAMDAAGEALAVWERNNAGQWTIEGAEMQARGGWQPPAELSQPGVKAVVPQLSMSPGGAAMVVWEQQEDDAWSVDASARQAGGEWQAPVAISQQVAHGEQFPQVAIDLQGDAVAAWELDDGTSYLVQAAGYQASGAPLQNVVIPATATVGEPAVFSASLFAAWAPLDVMRWSFGDASSASGASVTHSFSTPGVYQVAVTGEDALGNTSSDSGTTTVAPAAATTTSTITSTTTSFSSTATNATSAPPRGRSTFTILDVRTELGGAISLMLRASAPGLFRVCASTLAAGGPRGKKRRRRSIPYGCAVATAHAASISRVTIRPRHPARRTLRQRGTLHVTLVVALSPTVRTERSRKTKTVTVHWR